MKPADSLAASYEAIYREFDSPLMRELRREAYGEDIGQHSWVRADELRRDVEALELTRSSRLLDLGCGPCGPLTFILGAVGCFGVGLDQSSAALAVGRARAKVLGVEPLLTVQQADLNEPLGLEALAVIESAHRPVRIQHHRGGKHGTEQTSAPGLVQPGNQAIPIPARPPFEPARTHTAHEPWQRPRFHRELTRRIQWD